MVYSGGNAWTGDHERWLRTQRFDNPALQLSYEAAFDAMLACLDRRHRLDSAITAMTTDSEFTPVVHRLGCIRGVATLTAFGLAVEIGDWHRLTGRTIGAYVGLVPSEYSSGDTRTQGGVTKTGNGHVRRLLVEAAWHHRTRYRPGTELRRRWDLASPAARARGQAANRRLHNRWAGFDARQKRPVIANVAIARELAGWCWSLAIMPD
jgi:transposase